MMEENGLVVAVAVGDWGVEVCDVGVGEGDMGVDEPQGVPVAEGGNLWAAEVAEGGNQEVEACDLLVEVDDPEVEVGG